jgi:streptogramin lyase
MPNFNGVVQIQDGSNNPTLILDGDNGDLTVGGGNLDGTLLVATGAGVTRVAVDGANGTVTINAADGDPLVTIDGTGGDITVFRKIGGINREILEFNAAGAELIVGSEGNAGDIVVRDAAGSARITLDASQGDIVVKDASGNVLFQFDSGTAAVFVGGQGNEGDVVVRDAASLERIKLDGGEGDIWARDAAGNVLLQFDNATAALYVGGPRNEGDVVVRDGENRQRIKLDGGEGDIWVKDAKGSVLFHFDSQFAALYVGGRGNEGDVVVRDEANRERIKLDAGEGDIWVKNPSGNLLLHFDSEFAALYVGGVGNEGDVVVRNGDGNQTIKLDGGLGDIILNNADAAEDFDVSSAAETAPGMVMVLAEDGRLVPCSQAYDRKVVGVVSGAGQYRPGLVLDRGECPDPQRAPISMMGKVACRADASYGRIAIGDLLTTSPSPGCAMKASDPARAFGAVIGKALSKLDDGEGLVSMIISLQ